MNGWNLRLIAIIKVTCPTCSAVLRTVPGLGVRCTCSTHVLVGADRSVSACTRH